MKDILLNLIKVNPVIQLQRIYPTNEKPKIQTLSYYEFINYREVIKDKLQNHYHDCIKSVFNDKVFNDVKYSSPGCGHEYKYELREFNLPKGLVVKRIIFKDRCAFGVSGLLIDYVEHY